jgi:hypothetical protein
MGNISHLFSTLFILFTQFHCAQKPTSSTSTPSAQAQVSALPSTNTCLTPATFPLADPNQLIIRPLSGVDIATPFTDFSTQPTLLLHADLGSGTYMKYQITPQGATASTNNCLSKISASTRGPSLMGMASHEAKNTAVVYGLCPGVYGITLQSCRDNDGRCGPLYPAPNTAPLVYQQAAPLSTGDAETLNQYMSTKNMTHTQVQQAYAIITQWVTDNCITPAQMQTTYCMSNTNIVNMGLATYINLLQDNLQSTSQTIQAHVNQPAQALALAASPQAECTTSQNLLPPPPATTSGTVATTSQPINETSPETEGETEPSTATTAISSSGSSNATRNLTLTVVGASLAAIGSVMWLYGGYQAITITNTRRKFELNQLHEELKNIKAGQPGEVARRINTTRELPLGTRSVPTAAEITKTAKGKTSASKWTVLAIAGVALTVVGVIVPLLTNLNLAGLTDQQKHESDLNERLGQVASSLEASIDNEYQALASTMLPKN